MTELNRRTVDKVRAYAEELGYRVKPETDLLDISGQISIYIRGYGEEFDVYFKVNPGTGYLRWDYGGQVYDYHTERRSWTRVQEDLRAVRALGLEMGYSADTEPEESE